MFDATTLNGHSADCLRRRAPVMDGATCDRRACSGRHRRGGVYVFFPNAAADSSL